MRRLILALCIGGIFAVIGAAQTTDEFRPAPQVLIEDALVQVSARRANVRNFPDIEQSRVVDIALRGEVYDIDAVFERRIGEDDFGNPVLDTWYLIRINGGQAWISDLVVLVVNEDLIPIVNGRLNPRAAAETGLDFPNPPTNTTFALSVRSGPASFFARIDTVPSNTILAPLGRNALATWVFVRYVGGEGWVSSDFLEITSSELVVLPILPNPQDG